MTSILQPLRRASIGLGAMALIAAPGTLLANPAPHPSDHPTEHPSPAPTEHPSEHPHG